MKIGNCTKKIDQVYPFLYILIFLSIGLGLIFSRAMIDFVFTPYEKVFSLAEQLEKVFADTSEITDTSHTVDIMCGFDIPDELRMKILNVSPPKVINLFLKRNDNKIIPLDVRIFSWNKNMLIDCLARGMKNYLDWFIRILVLGMTGYWLLPLYKQNFMYKSVSDDQIKGRLESFQLFLFSLTVGVIVLISIFQYMVFVYHGGFQNFYFLLILETVLAVLVTSLFNLLVVHHYFQTKVSTAFFQNERLYTKKKGFYISIRSIVVLLLVFTFLSISLAYLPMLRKYLVYVCVEEHGESLLYDAHSINYFSEIYFSDCYFVHFFFYLIFFILLLFFTVIFFTKRFHKPINALIGKMEAVSNGDLSKKTTVLFSDEIGQLKARFNVMLNGLMERERIRSVFGKYVSSEIAERVLEKGNELEGVEIEATVMILDIRNFSILGQQFTPRKLVRFLNDFFSYAIKPVQENKGVVDKFIGDSMMVVFAPLFDQDDHCEAALRTAISIRKAIKQFNSSGMYTDTEIGIGMHVGKVIAGNIGVEDRMEFTLIGNTVNLTARIEGKTKELATDILISSELYNKLNRDVFAGVAFKEYRDIRLKGITDPVVLYAVK